MTAATLPAHVESALRLVQSYAAFEAGGASIVVTPTGHTVIPAGDDASTILRFVALGRAVVAYERLKPRADGGAIEIPTAERAAQVVAARAEVQRILGEMEVEGLIGERRP